MYGPQADRAGRSQALSRGTCTQCGHECAGFTLGKLLEQGLRYLRLAVADEGVADATVDGDSDDEPGPATPSDPPGTPHGGPPATPHGEPASQSKKNKATPEKEGASREVTKAQIPSSLSMAEQLAEQARVVQEQVKMLQTGRGSAKLLANVLKEVKQPILSVLSDPEKQILNRREIVARLHKIAKKAAYLERDLEFEMFEKELITVLRRALSATIKDELKKQFKIKENVDVIPLQEAFQPVLLTRVAEQIKEWVVRDRGNAIPYESQPVRIDPATGNLKQLLEHIAKDKQSSSADDTGDNANCNDMLEEVPKEVEVDSIRRAMLIALIGPAWRKVRGSLATAAPQCIPSEDGATLIRVSACQSVRA